jgi:SM-20-related protein
MSIPGNGAIYTAPVFDEEALITSLSQDGYFVLDNFLAPNHFAELRLRLIDLWENDQFRRAGIGKMTNFQKDAEIRGDKVFWIEEEDAVLPVKAYLDLIESLRMTVKRGLFLPLRCFESHFAVYPPGSFYKRHRDNFNKLNHRLISVVLYLNENWKAEEGGILRLYPEGKEVVDVEPIGSRLVIFRSDLEHEVLPCNAPRYSITGWMRDQPIGLSFL